jgi:hypothetical protein
MMSRYTMFIVECQKSLSLDRISKIILSNKERKGIRFQFRNLLSIRLLLASSSCRKVIAWFNG